MFERMKQVAKELNEFLLEPPIAVDEIEEEDLKSELLEAATLLVSDDEITESTAETLSKIGAVIPEDINVKKPEKGKEKKDVAKKPEKAPKKEAKAKGKKAPAPKKEPKAKAPAKPKKEAKKPEPKKDVKPRAGRANTKARREYMAELIQEGKHTYRDILMKVCQKFPMYSPLTTVTDLANAGNPEYSFYPNVVGKKPDGSLYFTKEKGNGELYYGTKDNPRGPAEKPAPKKPSKKKG